ncbi:MAG: CPBP family intramembrane glutamic endopeptidase [Leptolyngbyaceae cyanobacterium bins.59]|nr:CPBP family intramembrane glutamic endopeptidase [Leptolyngbyaceae cyanobacterium bins.59]
MTDPPFDPLETEFLSRRQVLTALGVTAVILLVISTLWRKLGTIALFPWHWNWLAVLFGVGLGLGITGASSLVYRLWPSYRLSADFYLRLVLKPLNWFDLIWLGLLPGLSEELLFRGVMLPALGLNGFGLLASSLCFGILHMNGWKQWPYAVWATCIGLLLGYSALATQNLLVPIIAHILTNLMSGLIWKFQHPDEEDVHPSVS